MSSVTLLSRHNVLTASRLLFALTLFYGLYKFFQKPNPATGNVEMTAEQQENTMKGGETVTETAVPGS